MDIPKLLQSLAQLAWPILASVLVYKLFPTVVNLVQKNGIKVKVGEVEVSIQDASDKFRQQIEDLQKKVSEIRTVGPGSLQRTLAPALTVETRPLHVLWVDDAPTNNAFEIARLQESRVEVSEATSTQEALSILSSNQGLGAIISDMGRREGGVRRPRAGLELISAVRAKGIATPIFVYTAQRGIERVREDVAQVGGNGATASPVELFEMLDRALGIQA